VSDKKAQQLLIFLSRTLVNKQGQHIIFCKIANVKTLRILLCPKHIQKKFKSANMEESFLHQTIHSTNELLFNSIDCRKAEHKL